MAALFAYVAGSSFVLQEQYGLDEQQFGLAFGAGAVGLIGGDPVQRAAAAPPLAAADPGRRTGRGALAGLALLAFAATGFGGLPALLVSLWVVLAAAGLAMPNAPALALSRHGEAAGTASALLGAVQFGVGAVAAPLVGVLGTGAVADGGGRRGRHAGGDGGPVPRGATVPARRPGAGRGGRGSALTGPPPLPKAVVGGTGGGLACWLCTPPAGGCAGCAGGSRLREIARQTVAIAESGRYRNGAGDEVVIGAQVRAAVAGTRHHLPDGTLTIGDTRVGAGDVEVTYQSTLQAARRLGPDAACLVFASAKNPGGRVPRRGEGAGGERRTIVCALPAPCSPRRLLRVPPRPTRPAVQRPVIYSPGVPVFRDDKGGLLDVAYQTSFLTAAAPNLGAIVRNQPAHAPDVPAVLRRRARRVLEVAAAHGHRTIVLGAWGCGVFRNDPATVADAFADALRMVDRFDRVVFAIRDNLSGTPVYGAFAERFGTSAPEPAGDARRG